MSEPSVPRWVKICLGTFVVAGLAQFVAAAIDGDVVGLLEMDYVPRALSARIIAAVSAVVWLSLLVVLAVWVLVRIVKHWGSVDA